MSSNTVCTGIAPNPDISGIGIRASLYATALLLSVIPRSRHTKALVGALASNAGINGLAVLITAIVQTSQKQLDLFHAIFILHLLTFVGVSVGPSGYYAWTSVRVGIHTVFTILASATHLIFAFYVWANAPTFGSQPECNDQVKYVLFFFTVRATVPWLRVVWLCLLAAICAVAILVPFIILCCYIMCREAVNRGGGGEDEFQGGPCGMDLHRIVGVTTTQVFSIIWLEMTVKANNIQGEAEWSFGQILAVVLLFSSANEILHFFLGLCKGEEAGDTVIAIRPSFARFSSDSSGSTRRRVPRGTIKNGSVSETGASSERVPLTNV